MFDYLATAQDALEALTEFGGADPGVTLTRTPPGAYKPGQGTGTPGEPTTWAGVGLVFDYDFKDSGASVAGASLIQAGDRRLYLAALGADGVAIVAPKHGDKCQAPDGAYKVENVKTLAPAGLAVLYDVQLRR